jgi:hypothetical protein
MSISVACPGCKSVMTVPDSAAGRSGTCRKCGTRVHVPEAEPQIMFDTPALEHTERAAQLRRPIAAPTRADAVAELYAEVPFYRRNGPVSAILDHSGRLVKWGPGNRYAAVVIVAVWAVIIVYKIKMG